MEHLQEDIKDYMISNKISFMADNANDKDKGTRLLAAHFGFIRLNPRVR
jgi:hypothetical protein